MKLANCTEAKIRTWTDDQLYTALHYERRTWNTETIDRVEAECERRRDKFDRKRLSSLVDDLVADLDANGETEIEFGWGVNHRVLTTEDLTRIAELLDPDTTGGTK